MWLRAFPCTNSPPHPHPKNTHTHTHQEARVGRPPPFCPNPFILAELYLPLSCRGRIPSLAANEQEGQLSGSCFVPLLPDAPATNKVRLLRASGSWASNCALLD